MPAEDLCRFVFRTIQLLYSSTTVVEQKHVDGNYLCSISSFYLESLKNICHCCTQHHVTHNSCSIYDYYAATLYVSCLSICPVQVELVTRKQTRQSCTRR